MSFISSEKQGMPDNTTENGALVGKLAMRQAIRKLPLERGISAESWCDAFEKLPFEASILIGYIPLPDEPDCMQIMQRWLGSGKHLYLPVFDGVSKAYNLAQVGGLDAEWLVKGKYGIPEPRQNIVRKVPPFIFDCMALWLVPGLAFSRTGCRLGRGAGYYDRLLVGSNAIKIGMAYSSRVRHSIPMDEHDIRVDWLLMETGPCSCQMETAL